MALQHLNGRPARARHFFAASHGGRGYSTLYHHLWESVDHPQILTLNQIRPQRLSRTIRMAGRMLLELGHDVEFIHSPWRRSHLEALAAPSVGLVVLGGSAAAHAQDADGPHIEALDAGPGAFCTRRRGSSLAQLGQAEHQRRLQEVDRLSRHACELLEVSMKLRRRMEKVISDDAQAMDGDRFHAISDELLAALVKSGDKGSGRGSTRYLFASAITADGSCNFLERLFVPIPNQWIVEGAPGIPKERFIRLVADAARRRGLDLILFPCALDPQRLEHVVIPDLGTAFVSSEPPHTYHGGERTRIIRPGDFLRRDRLEAFSEELEALREPFQAALDRAVWYLGRAADQLDEQEELVMHDIHGQEAGGRRLLQRVEEIAGGMTPRDGQLSGNHRW